MHNYEKKILVLQAEGKIPTTPGKTSSIAVGHESLCNIYYGGECNCDPSITVTEVTNENRRAVADRINKGTAEFRERMNKKKQ